MVLTTPFVHLLQSAPARGSQIGYSLLQQGIILFLLFTDRLTVADHLSELTLKAPEFIVCIMFF